MNTSMKTLVGGALLTGLLSLSTATLAMAQPGGHSPERMLQHMTEKLDLNDAQQEQVEAILAQRRADASADHQRMGEIRTALRAMRADFDADEARRLSDELGQIAARTSYSMTEATAEIYAILTPEQQADMERLSASREQRAKKRAFR